MYFNGSSYCVHLVDQLNPFSTICPRVRFLIKRKREKSVYYVIVLTGGDV